MPRMTATSHPSRGPHMRAVGLVLALVALASCGARSGEGPSPSPTPSPSVRSTTSPTSYPNARTLRDPSGSIQLQRGDEVVIELSSQAGFEPWGPIASLDADTIAALYPPVAAAPGHTTAALLALNAGSTQLQASTMPVCTPAASLPPGQGVACPAIARVWSLQVTVSMHERRSASIDAGIPTASTLHVQAGDALTFGPNLTPLSITPAAILSTPVTNGDGTQTVTAAARGSAEVTATTHYPCEDARPPCLPADRMIRLLVIVS